MQIDISDNKLEGTGISVDHALIPEACSEQNALSKWIDDFVLELQSISWRLSLLQCYVVHEPVKIAEQYSSLVVINFRQQLVELLIRDFCNNGAKQIKFIGQNVFLPGSVGRLVEEGIEGLSGGCWVQFPMFLDETLLNIFLGWLHN